MSKSVKRVARAASELGYPVEITQMGETTRTAEDAARACNCDVSQIVKSLIFRGRDTGDLILLLISGANQANLDLAAKVIGEPLDRADASEVRARTGFAIGGVSPIGHLEAPRILMDQDLKSHELIWAAAGAPDAVFPTTPNDLATMTKAQWADLT